MATPAPFNPTILQKAVHDFGKNSWLCVELAEKPAMEGQPAHRYLLLSRGFYMRKANNEPRRTAQVALPMDRATLEWLRKTLKKMGTASPAIESFSEPAKASAE